MPSPPLRVRFRFRFRRMVVLAAGMAVGMMTGCEGNPYTQGERLYLAYCANCHMDDGSGLGRLIPALTAERLALEDPARLICLIRRGLPRNPLTSQQMPANEVLTATELTNLINYLGYQYGSKGQTIRAEEVVRMETGCQTR